MHAKRHCGYACKKQVKILLCYYMIVERNTANTPFQVDTTKLSIPSVYRVFTGTPLVFQHWIRPTVNRYKPETMAP